MTRRRATFSDNLADFMRLSRLAFAATFLVVSQASAQERAVQTPPAIVGIWKLTIEKSTVRTPPDAVEIRQYTMRPDGFLVGLRITGTPQAYHSLQFVARSDGKDYPEYSDQNIADMVAAGKPTVRTYAERMLDEYTTEWIDKIDGRVTAQGKKIVSKDRKTLTITVDGSPAIRIYDRQSPARRRSSMTRRVLVGVFALATAWAFDASCPALRAQTGAAKVDVATIHRNKEIENARAGAPPGTPLGFVRMQMLP